MKRESPNKNPGPSCATKKENPGPSFATKRKSPSESPAQRAGKRKSPGQLQSPGGQLQSPGQRQSPSCVPGKRRSLKALNKDDHSSGKNRARTPRNQGISISTTGKKTVSIADKATTEIDPATCSAVLRDFALQTFNTGIDGLVREFIALKVEMNGPPASKTAFDANHDKNRYKDVYCKDETRVVLKWPPGSTNDYIHANWVTIQGEKSFICSQGPTEKTVDDFWRMIWENKCRAVVMLCNIMEKGRKKCEIYYPEKPESPPITTSSKIVIKNLGSTALEKILTVSILEVKVPSGEKFKVRHFFWNSWPDLGVPANIMACLRLLARLKSFYPVVVHCSAGVGRTGTIVGLEMCQQTIMSGEPLSILKIVKELRACRHGAVQTDIQYVYMHRVMLGLADNMKVVTQEELAPFYDAYDAFLKSRGC